MCIVYSYMPSMSMIARSFFCAHIFANSSGTLICNFDKQQIIYYIHVHRKLFIVSVIFSFNHWHAHLNTYTRYISYIEQILLYNSSLNLDNTEKNVMGGYSQKCSSKIGLNKMTRCIYTLYNVHYTLNHHAFCTRKTVKQEFSLRRNYVKNVRKQHSIK